MAPWVAATLLLASLLTAGGLAHEVPTPADVCSLAVPAPTALVGVDPAARRAVARYLRRADLRIVGGVPQIHALQVRFRDEHERARHLDALRAFPGVRFADPDDRVYRIDDTPTDPLYRRQWGLRKVEAPAGWNVEVGTTTPVTVAVLDTGADFEHPDLARNLLEGFNAAAPGSPPADDHTHGTHVAGIVAATTNNGVGISGMSWTARILPVKAMRADGTGNLCDVAASVVYVASRSPDVLNMSIGAAGPCPGALQAALDLAHSRGVLSIAAAGNSGAAFNLSQNPGNCEHTVAVAATDQDDRAAPFSNFGDYVDVAAPGVDILSTVVVPAKDLHTYAELSGTSMAAPMVAGLAALLASHHPDWTPDQIAAHILATADDLGPRGRDVHFGAGRINVRRALQ